MVSLFDLCLQLSPWAHLSTGLPSLDALLQIHSSESILDFQTVPLNNFMHAVLSNLIASHLKNTTHRSVIIIETFNPFQFSQLHQHPDFEPSWLTRIRRFKLDSFPRVLSFFLFNPLKDEAKSTLILIMNFHEMLEYYKLQLTVTYQEALLKHRIEYNGTVLENKERIKADGLDSVDLPKIPPNSDLLNMNPILKNQEHINEMFKQIGKYLFRNSLLVILAGGMNTKRVPSGSVGVGTPMALSQLASFLLTQDIPSQHQDIGQGLSQVFDPVSFDRLGALRKALNDHKISHRLLFYYDSYTHTPHFQQGIVNETSKSRSVGAVKVSRLLRGGNISDPVYFDFYDGFYKDNLSAELSQEKKNILIDLLHLGELEFSSFLEETINLTQLQMRPLSERRLHRSQILQIASSPVAPDKARKRASSDHDESEKFPRRSFSIDDENLVIEASDNELTGTFLDDLL